MTTRGIPQVYYGTELAFAAPAGVQGDGAKRAEMPGGWEGDERSVFTASGRTDEENDMLGYVSAITNWRKDSEAIHKGKLIHYVPENNTYVYFRYTDNDRVMVIMNMNDEPVSISREKHIQMLRGFSSGTEVIDGKFYDVSKDFEVPDKTTTVLQLK